MFQIVYSKKALKFLKKQDIPTRKRIVAAIDRLPAEGDIKKLQGVNGYRLRVGTFRTISGNPRQFNYRDESAGLCISAH